MEHAPLRPVPARPPGPVDAATALNEVASWLPELDQPAARAFALVVVAERPRAEVAESLGVSGHELGALLAAARKELRQTVVTLGGSGWCERAEGLISDRLDSVLADTDVRRLDVHLRNCGRCVEHERRLVQATDALVIGLGGRPSPVAGAPAPLVEAVQTNYGTEEDIVPAAPATPSPATASQPTENEIAAAAEVLVTRRTHGQIAAAVVWNSMVAISILLAIVTIAVTIIGILGGHL
ncbi:MAG TPA: zf-HC2 domain-containing protein [Thermoleophilaceae bacterium]